MVLKLYFSMIRTSFLLLIGLFLFKGLQTDTFAQQPVYVQQVTTLPVTVNGNLLSNPWAGGLNSPQFVKFHLNADTIEDLIIVDRTNRQRFQTFLAVAHNGGYNWRYHPEYEHVLPKSDYWLIANDFNNDGRKDLLTQRNFLVELWKNITVPGQLPNFQLLDNNVSYFEPTGSIPINIAISAGDIPVWKDVDYDGDADVLSFDFQNGGNLFWYKNLRVELSLHPDTMRLLLQTQCWGNFFESDSCGGFTTNYPCPQKPAPNWTQLQNARPQHVGSTVSLFDIDNDNDYDLFLGDISCNPIYYLANVGNAQSPLMAPPAPTFPANTIPASLPIFPASYFVDVTFDQKPDLIVAPNTFSDEANTVDFSFSAWLYTNVGQGNSNQFVFSKTNFLQETMVDIGQMAKVVLEDVDQDGDLDIVTGSDGRLLAPGNYRSSLMLFTNSGNPVSPAFTLTNNDFLGLLAMGRREVTPLFIDFNSDGKRDLIVTSRGMTGSAMEVRLYTNTALTASSPYQFSFANSTVLGIPMSIGDHLAIHDMDNDNDLDLLIGKGIGRLEYRRNDGNGIYTLVTNRFMGFDFNSLALSVSPYIVDIDGDNFQDLLVTSTSGKIIVIYNVKQNLTDSLPRQEVLHYIPAFQQVSELNLGTGVSLGIGDLNGDFVLDFVAGTFTGGFHYLQNTNGFAGIGQLFSAPPTKPSFDLYPVPTTQHAWLRSTQKGTVEIYSIDGRMIRHYQLQDTDEPLWIENLPNAGVYTVRFTEESTGAASSRKLIVLP
jgi:hypothetical protein